MTCSVLSVRALIATALTAAAALSLPGLASATTTVSRDSPYGTTGGTITIVGDDEPSLITNANSVNSVWVVDELGGDVVAGERCVQQTRSAVLCGGFGKENSFGKGFGVDAKLGGGDDTFRFAYWVGQVTVDGGEGNDVIDVSIGRLAKVTGGPGDDVIAGGPTNDTLDGGEGNDTITGWAGSDRLIGGPGRDVLVGDGEGVPYEDSGLDVILARDGERDDITCGLARTEVVADDVDEAKGCGVVDRPVPTAVPAALPTPAPLAAPAPKLALTRSAVKKPSLGALAKGKAVSITLTANAACAGKVDLTVSAAEAKRAGFGKKSLTLATGRTTTFAAGAATTVDLVVAKKQRAKLADARRLKATLVTTCAGSGGAVSSATAITFAT